MVEYSRLMDLVNRNNDVWSSVQQLQEQRVDTEASRAMQLHHTIEELEAQMESGRLEVPAATRPIAHLVCGPVKPAKSHFKNSILV